MKPEKFREVKPYKKVATFCKFFLCTLVDQGVHHFLFISDEHIVKQSKTSMLQNNIYEYSLFIIYYDFLKIFIIVGNVKKSVDTMRKVAS